MKLEEQVCSLELAKKLKELGITVKSFAYYDALCGALMWPAVAEHYTVFHAVGYSAFSVAELGAMLPDDRQLVFMARKAIDGCLDNSTKSYLINPNLIAKMLIWLLENGHITVGGWHETEK